MGRHRPENNTIDFTLERSHFFGSGRGCKKRHFRFSLPIPASQMCTIPFLGFFFISFSLTCLVFANSFVSASDTGIEDSAKINFDLSLNIGFSSKLNYYGSAKKSVRIYSHRIEIRQVSKQYDKRILSKTRSFLVIGKDPEKQGSKGRKLL